MNIADRIQNLRKSKGYSQEELADKMGISRQSISKWESEQSSPDIDKIILMSEIFGVTTDYLLKGIEPVAEETKSKVDARIFAIVGTAFNFIGLIASITIWLEIQKAVAVAIGLILMAMGIMIFVVGQVSGTNKKVASLYFGIINIWFLSLIPVSCIFNAAQGIIGGYWWTLTPIPQIGNSIGLYGLCWLLYIVIGVVVDFVYIKFRKI